MATDGGPQHTPLFIGCLLTGVIFAPFNPSFDDDETRHVLGFLRPRVLIAEKSKPLYERLTPLVVSYDEVDAWFSDSSVEDADPEVEEAPALDSPAIILCSSGTTGYPKGVEVSHRSLLQLVAIATDQRMLMWLEGSFLLPTPAFWISVTMLLLMSINAGKKVLLMGKFDEQLFLKVLREHQVFISNCTVDCDGCYSPKLQSAQDG
ncbi:4-coumarate--CoA ligase-like 5 [Schistocerca americana]|uniref:4-coumarate--CoA ligase-like 5 n=1 Tax=Schistocerca americana TaxID=7009 RepID=UPI001F4FED15|nr:4-coumarate--CoA ligase-like 5 [Schistocerca americana]